jgi:hypothetical protein
MAEREELKGRDEKYRKDDPEHGKSASGTGEPGRSNEPGRQGQGGSQGNPDSPPSSPRKGSDSESEENQ